ncbi:hypothetical protein AMJ86_05620 [bacterium SM23_57]|nr:MAG: hypothetical protein AMJ86_05620 [bacterium SM23_57]
MVSEIDLLIHGALWREVSETLARLKLRPADRDELVGNYHLSAHWKYYEGDVNSLRVGLIITGIGRRRTRQALKWLRRIRIPNHILSIGTGGALDPEMSLGKLWIANWVASLSNYQSEGKYDLVIPEILKTMDSGGLITAANPVLRETVRDQIREGTGAQVVDMEGVAVARWGAKHDRPVTIVKVLTDYSAKGAEREYSQQIATASRLLSDFCHDLIVESHRLWSDS